MGSDDLFKKRKIRKNKNSAKQKKELISSILIVCEGEKTEPNYFKSFPKSGVEVKIIGEGKNTNSLVNAAIEHWEILAEDDYYYENMYIVMDRDSFKTENYNKSFKIVENFIKKVNRKKKYKHKLSSDFKASIIYTNEAFELWYLLHYDYYHSAIARDKYKELLDKKMNIDYEKKSNNIYNILKNITDKNKGLQFAINNAVKLRKKNKPQTNPSTNVDILVKELICRYFKLKKTECKNKNDFHYP